MFAKLAIFAFVAVLVAADTGKESGPCGEVPAVEHFDAAKYAQGTWYLVKHNDDDTWKCVHANINVVDKNFHVEGFKNGVKLDHTVPFKTVSPGVFSVEGYGQFDGVSKVIATDYDNYAVYYKCLYDASDNTHKNLVFIDVRHKHVANPSATIETAKAAIEHHNLHPGTWHEVSHEGCDHEHH